MSETIAAGPSPFARPGFAPPPDADRERLLDAWRAEFVAAAKGFHLFPEVMRRRHLDDVSILHAFVRGLDDEVDDASDPTVAAARLAEVEGQLRGERPRGPLVDAVLDLVERTGAGLGSIEAFLEGMRYDLDSVRVADDAELVRYAYRVSSSVGLVIYAILGIEGADARLRAVDLGIALQLTNVALDVAEDAARDRVYLPAARLVSHGVLSGEIVDGTADPAAVDAVVAEVVDLAEPYYASGLEGMPDVPLLYRHGLLLMTRLYRAAGLRVARGLDPRLPPAEVALRFAETLGLALGPRQLGFAPRRTHDPGLHRPIAGPAPNPNPGADAEEEPWPDCST